MRITQKERDKLSKACHRLRILRHGEEITHNIAQNPNSENWLAVVNDVRTIIRQKREHIYIPDLEEVRM